MEKPFVYCFKDHQIILALVVSQESSESIVTGTLYNKETYPLLIPYSFKLFAKFDHMQISLHALASK